MKWRPQQRAQQWVAGLMAALALFITCSRLLTSANGVYSSTPAWASPSVMTLKRVSALPSAQNEPHYLSNLDCSLLNYRLVGSSDVRSGCFTETAFGLMDSGSNIVVFNGTDEGLPLLPYTPGQGLVAWPKAENLLSLISASTGGTYVGLYKNPLAVLRDQRDVLFQLTAKQLTAPPDLELRDPSGAPLVINSQNTAFSDGGSWMVAEDLNGSFVRINLGTLQALPFAPSYFATGVPAVLKSLITISHDGRYVAIYNAAAAEFKVYDLTTCSAGNAVNLQPQHCASYDYRPFVGQQLGGLQQIEHLRFVNDGLLSFEAVSSDSNIKGTYELAPTAGITSLINYLGLGDSYTSGEGAFDYLDGTDTPDDSCHLSARSYPLLLTNDLFGALGGHSVACSGAEINDVDSVGDNYRGQARGIPDWQDLEKSNPGLLDSVMTNFTPGYVAQQRFVAKYQPGVATVSIGGNDIGFGDILQRCVMPHLGDNTCFDTYESRREVTNLIDRTVPRWTALYKQLSGEAPGARLYVIGYPQIVSDTGSCGLNVHLSKAELEFSEELIDYLDGAIAQAAGQAGVTYVDISQALAGHRLCEASAASIAVNGLTAGSDGGVLGIKVLGKESYHPNALGQALMEQAILKQTHNLTVGAAVVASQPNSQNLLNAPKSGRATTALVPDDNLISPLVPRGQSTTLQVSGSRDGLGANSSYSVRLDGPNGPIIGTANSDSSGNISTTISLPANTAPGGHTIDVTGSNQAGEPVDITQPIYIPVTGSDSDGDGLPDNSDSCPTTINSGQDSDQDGIDDACDGFIGPPPSSRTTDPSQLGSSAADQATDPVITDDSNGIMPDDTQKVLGAATINPAVVRNKSFKLTGVVAKNDSPRAVGRIGLRTIGWLPWLVLPVIAWLLLLCLVWLLNRLSQ